MADIAVNDYLLFIIEIDVQFEIEGRANLFE